ncbi:MAG: hypothetical protein SWI22_13495 [Pseudomonadota bacterium]|nr:hypothetical protein [Pseudomonadota bacterium]
MTTVEPAASPSAWSWWEGRRLRFNIGLFVVGWTGFGLQAAAFSLWSSEPIDLAYLALWQGLVYVFYMVAANIAYLLGVFAEVIIKPRPLGAFRTYAWRLGFLAAIGLPLIVAGVFASAIGWPTNVG